MYAQRLVDPGPGLKLALEYVPISLHCKSSYFPKSRRLTLAIAGPENWATYAFTYSKWISRVSSLLSDALAFGLLFGAIEALHGQKDHGKRLGILAAFVLAFAICVMLFTGAKITDTFAATAAYAAVLVVYVSGPGSGD